MDQRNKWIKGGLIAAVALLAGIVAWNAFTLNFTMLGAVALFLIIGIWFVPEETGDRLMAAVLALGLFGAFCIVALHNYLYPPRQVFSAIDHHALRLDGVAINRPQGFVLAGDSDDAFFDDDQMTGRLSVVGVIGDTAVVVESHGFTRPVYKARHRSDGRCESLDLLSPERHLAFADGQTLTITTRAGVRRTFGVHEKHAPATLWRHAKDSTVYTWNGDTTAERRFLRQSLPLSTLSFGLANIHMADTVSDEVLADSVDLRGISLIRPHINLQAKRDKLHESTRRAYALDLRRDAFGAADVDPAMAVAAIAVNGRSHSMADLRGALWRDTIGIGKQHSWLIGCGLSKTRPVYFEMQGQTLLLKFRQPIYARLSLPDGSPTATTLVTTTIDGQEQSLPPNVTLFDLFHRAGNRNNMDRGYYLAYADVPTSGRMHFSLTGKNNAAADVADFVAGNPLAGVRSGDGRLDYLLQVEDFSRTTPFPAADLLRWLMFATMALAALLMLGARVGSDKSGMAGWNSTLAETACYLLLLFLLTVRFFLLWRTSVFLPTQVLSAYYFELWRNPGNLSLTLKCLVAFCVVVALAKIYLMHRRRLSVRLSENLLNLMNKYWWCALVALWLLAVLLVLLLRGSGGGKVLCGVVGIYIMGEMLIHADTSFLGEKSNNELLKTFMLSLLNGLIVSGCLLVYDSGFGIMFLSFVLLWTVYNLWQSFIVGQGSKAPWYLIVLLFAVVVFMFAFYRSVILFYFHHRLLFSLLVGLCVCGLGVLVLRTFGIELGRVKWRLPLWGWLVALALATLVATSGAHSLFIFKDHTRQRVLVHVASPYENLSGIRSQADESRFVQASANDWVLDQYNRRGSEIQVGPGHEGNRYFKLMPHSQVGALWGAQATDIALARFVIAEHSGMLAGWMVLLAFVLLLVSMTLHRRKRTASNLMIQIPLLLFVQMLLIWMANTRRFIFFGQDFPMVSITSTFSQVYFFALLALWAFVVVRESFALRGEAVRDAEKEKWQGIRHQFVIMAGYSVALGVVAWAVILFTHGYDYSRDKGADADTYTVAGLYEELHGKIDEINTLFTLYQDSLPRSQALRLRPDMSGDIRRFYAKNKAQVDTILAGTTYVKGLWESFVAQGACANNSQAVIHVRGHGRFKNDNPRTGIRLLRLATRRNFMDMRLPRAVDQWHGNVTEQLVRTHSDSTRSVTVTRNDGVRCYHLPPSWSPDKSVTHLATLVQGSRELDIAASPKRLADRGRCAAMRIYSDDMVNGDDGMIARLTGASRHIFARSVRVNGELRSVYPLRERFFWAKLFADRARAVVRDEEAMARDICVTIDYNLTDRLYDRLGRTRRTHSVVVADGDGRVRAIVDRKAEKYTKNPNHQRELDELMEELYLNGDNNAAARYFSPATLQLMTNGPGSSQKPLVWTAVASGMNWSRIDMLTLRGNTNYNSDWFAGNRFSIKPLPSSASDESGGARVGISNYMSCSSNFYNAMMVYLGSLDATLLQTPDFYSLSGDGGLFGPVPAGSEQRARAFPIVMLGDRECVFTRPVTAEGVERGLLHANMEALFGLPGERPPYYENWRHGALPGRNWHHASSVLLSQRRVSPGSDAQRMDWGIRATAVGAASAWGVTPFAMAEMFGRMTAMNPAYSLTFDPDVRPERGSWEAANPAFWRGRRQLMEGMRNVFAAGGTAGNSATRTLATLDGYYAYGKTGTIGEGGKNHHRLAVIITNTRLENITGAAGLRNVKYVVIYFAFDETGGWQQYADCVREVMESDSFKNYMR